jgi:hypothetical protein
MAWKDVVVTPPSENPIGGSLDGFEDERVEQRFGGFKLRRREEEHHGCVRTTS